jgi:hypothetical protein
MVIYLLSLLAGLSLADIQAGDSPAPRLAGTWENERCVTVVREGRTSSSKSRFTFRVGEWTLEFTQYADGECRTPALRAFFEGPYQIERPSTGVPGAHDVTFGFARKRVALYQQGLLVQANDGACGPRRWTYGESQDVSDRACFGVVPISACAEEYDLVKVEGDRLFLGERPAPGRDLCAPERRAPTLRSVALVRR